MMGEKKLSEIKAELVAHLSNLPGSSPRTWLERRLAEARKDPKRDLRALKMLIAALEDEVRKVKRKRRPAKRIKR